MPYATVGNHKIYYQVHGQGTPLVLLHHGLGSSRDWVEQIPAFAPHYRVMANDRYGYGRSDERVGFGLDFFERDMADLVELLGQLGVTGAHVCGHSDGGTIAMLLAAHHPKLVRSLVLIGAHAYFEEALVPGLMNLRSKIEGRTWQAYLTKHHGQRGPRLARLWLDHWLDPAWRSWDIRPQLRQIRSPSLIIQGEQDQYAPLSHAETIADNIPESELWIVPGAGHNPQVENAELFNERVLAFLTPRGPRKPR